MERRRLSDELADAFLAARWRVDMIAESGAARLDRWPRWMEGLALAVTAVHRVPPVDRRDDLVTLIETFLAQRQSTGEEPVPQILRDLGESVARPGLTRARTLMHRWPVTEIDSVTTLADRLELSGGQLAWLADVRSLERAVADERLRNYRYQVRPRRGGLPRVIEAPKGRLKEVQRWVLREILDHVPPHPMAHGFTRGRSVVSHAQLHTGQEAVLRLDLKDFFASIAARRVYGLFRTLGYDPPVAHVLTGLTTNTIPQAVWGQIPRATDARLIQPRFWLGRQLATPHLPQGAPTSPALANLAAFRLDRRLAGLAGRSGLRYSRYADDLAFSGPRHLCELNDRLQALIDTIAHEEGFALNPNKSVLQLARGCQSVCGIVVNAHPNTTRRDYDQLKAILHNAARYGPASQNRLNIADFEAHLRGQIAWTGLLNPRRANKLQRRFAKIDWS